jgi:hypothetical protein
VQRWRPSGARKATSTSTAASGNSWSNTLEGALSCRSKRRCEFRRPVVRRGAPGRSRAYPDCLPCSVLHLFLLRRCSRWFRRSSLDTVGINASPNSRYTRAEISVACAKGTLTAINSVRNVRRTPHGSEQVLSTVGSVRPGPLVARLNDEGPVQRRESLHRLQVIAQSRSEVVHACGSSGLLCSSSTTAARVNSKGAFSSISFSNCLRVCTVTRGSGLSPPVLKEGAIPRDAEGAIFHGARGKRISSHLRLCRVRRMVFGHQRGTARGHPGTARILLRRFRKCPSLPLTLRREPRWPIQAFWHRKRGSALTRNDRWPPTAIKARPSAEYRRTRKRTQRRFSSVLRNLPRPPGCTPRRRTDGPCCGRRPSHHRARYRLPRTIR